MKNKFLPALFVLSIIFLTFTGGAITFHYKLPFTSFISESLMAAEAWIEEYKLNITLEKEQSGEQHKNKKHTIRWNKSKAYNGYTLISYAPSKKVNLINMQGKLLHQWNARFGEIWTNPEHVYYDSDVRVLPHKVHVYPNGDLLAQFTANNQTPFGYGIAKLDKNSEVIWKYSAKAHHDFYVDQTNAEIYTLTHEIMYKSPENIKNLYFPMLIDYLIRLSPEGKELEKLSLLEAFRNSDFLPLLYYKKHTKKWNLFHTNSIMKLEPDIADKFPLFKAGQVLISIRNPNIIAVVDFKKKAVIWASKGAWKQQHDAKFLNDGTISIYDNKGYHGTNGVSGRVIVFDPRSMKIPWSYTSNPKKRFYTDRIGRTSALENGNFLVTVSKEQNIFEVTRDHKVVWDYHINAHKGFYFRSATRYTRRQLPFLFEK